MLGPPLSLGCGDPFAGGCTQCTFLARAALRTSRKTSAASAKLRAYLADLVFNLLFLDFVAD
ncbi:MAG TPA: hypothetical protein VNH83_00790 [Bryobacteraceae bacterium]|nr:hypothetical protein [Bryobacteraceae bacterium]